MVANLLLLLTAAIWGFAFVAQRIGSQYVGAFTFNGIRFALGSISLVPLIFYLDRRRKYTGTTEDNIEVKTKKILIPGALVGTVAYAGSTLQQMGLIYTTAGKAGFITGFYMIIVPIIGIFLGIKIMKNSWIGIGLAVIGLYFLSVTENLSVNYGDLLEIIGAVFWAVHILAIDHFSKKVDCLKLSCLQFATCSILSLISAFIFEPITVNSIKEALVPILYGGLLSVGVAYTLQVVAQKNANPAHAGIIMSMESVFGAIGGALILGETMSTRGYLGCLFIIGGIIISQIKFSSDLQHAAEM